MGLTACSVHVRLAGGAATDVEAALRQTLEARGMEEVADSAGPCRPFILAPGPGRWFTVLGCDSTESEDFARELSLRLAAPAVSVSVADSDEYRLRLFRKGKATARMTGAVGDRKPPPIAAGWLELLAGTASAQDLAASLHGETPFAEQMARAFLACLGIEPSRCLIPVEDCGGALPAGWRRLTYRTRASSVKENPPQFRLAVQPAPVKLSAGDPLLALRACVANAGGLARGIRVCLTGSFFAIDAVVLQVERNGKLEQLRAAPGPAADGRMEAVFEDVSLPGVPRSGSVAEVTAGWRAASLFAHLEGRADVTGSGVLSFQIEPFENPSGAVVAELPVEVGAAPRLPLRAVSGASGAARDLADPKVLLAMVSLDASRAGSAAAVRHAIDAWVEALGGEWSLTVQRDAMDFELRPGRVAAARRASSKRWKDALHAVESCHLLWGTIGPYPRLGIGTAAFVLDAAGAPQLALWVDTAAAPAGAWNALSRLVEELVREADPLQAFLARWNWKPLSLGATLYETVCGIGGPRVVSAPWCGCYLRGVGERIWLGVSLAARVDQAALGRVAELTPIGAGWWVSADENVDWDALEQALAPVLAGREEWAKPDFA